VTLAGLNALLATVTVASAAVAGDAGTSSAAASSSAAPCFLVGVLVLTPPA